MPDPETDEPVEQSLIDRIRRDSDARLMAGCFVFSIFAVAQTIGAIAVYAYLDPHSFNALWTAVLTHLLISSAVGIVGVLVEPTSGFFGSLGGSLAGGVFIFLRLRENALGMPGTKGLEPAEYPAFLSVAIPPLSFLFLLIVLTLVLRLRTKTTSSA